MKTMRKCPASPARRRLLLAVLAVALLPGAAGADVATDEDRYRVLEFDWQDTARERAVPVLRRWHDRARVRRKELPGAHVQRSLLLRWLLFREP